MSDDKPLNPRQELFVKNMAKGTSATQAIINAGYNVSTRDSANRMGSRLMSQPSIKNALAAALDKRFPDLPNEAADTIHSIMTDASQPAAIKLKAIEVLAKIFGWHAPTKHAQINYSVQEKFKLPEE